MIDRIDKKVSSGICVAGLLVGAMITAGCSEKSIYENLDDKCKSGDTIEIDGADIAVINLLLTDNQIILSTNRFNIQSNGNGEFSIHPRTKLPIKILPEGRVVMTDDGIDGGTSEESAIAIFGTNDNGKTRVYAAMNCKDRNIAPPDIRNNNGFSPDKKRSKQSPIAYKGFGIR